MTSNFEGQFTFQSSPKKFCNIGHWRWLWRIQSISEYPNWFHFSYLSSHKETEKNFFEYISFKPGLPTCQRVVDSPKPHWSVRATYFPQASRKKTRKIREEMRSGAFHFGNRCTGISSISRAARRPPRSTGTNPRPRIKSSTDSLATWTSPA